MLTAVFNVKVKKIGWLILGVVLLATGPGRAENVTVRGNMSSAIRYELQHQITAGDGMKTMSLSFVVPQTFQSPTYFQEMNGPAASSRVSSSLLGRHSVLDT